MGYARTALLLAALTGLFLAVGWLLAGEMGLVIALAAAGGINLFAYWNSDRVILATYGAEEVDRESAPRLHAIVARLAKNASLPMPRVFMMRNPQPNAFATGRNPENAAVAATTGLLDLLTDEEIAGVMAHELAHVSHRDTLIMTVTATIAGALGMLANLAFFVGAFGGSSSDNRNNPLGPLGALLLAILAPIAAMIVQMAISRSREYEADRLGAEICGRPLWLASALAKLEHGSEQIDNPAAESHPATAHLFIVNPLHGQGLRGLFTTHPAIADRIERLRRMSVDMGPSGPWG